MTGDTTANEA